MEKNYRIVITRVEPNPKFAQEMEERTRPGMSFATRSYDRMDDTFPPEKITTDILVTEVSEEQFEKIRKEVLTVF